MCLSIIRVTRETYGVVLPVSFPEFSVSNEMHRFKPAQSMEINFKFHFPATFEGGCQCKNHFIDAFRPM